MLPSRLTGYLRSLREVDASSDASLLARFAENGDPEAFELLVWRHGSLVLGICRRILREHHAAEDAFQATFLILSRRAGSIRGSLAPWLYSVARRVSLRSQKRRTEALLTDVAAPAECPLLENQELLAALDAEIARLPEKQRRVVVLCYLQNLTAEAAGRELGIPRGTVLSRLDTARRNLQAALARRGIAPLAILTVSLISASPSSALVHSTQQALLEFASGPTATPITELATEVLQMTTRKWIAATTLGIVVLAFASTGVGLFNAHGPAASQALAQAPAETPKPAATKLVDPDEAKALKMKEQGRQLEKLEVTELELKQRIDRLSAQIAKEQDKRAADVNPRALMQALDKIDQQILDQEAMVPIHRAKVEEEKSYLRADKNYSKVLNPSEVPIERSTNAYNRLHPAIREKLLAVPEFAEHLKGLDAIDEEIRGISRSNPKSAELVKRREKHINDFANNVKAAVAKKLFGFEQESYHEILTANLLNAEVNLKASEDFPKTVAKRKAELAERLRRASGVSEEQKLLEDELQVLREFRKAVLKQKLTLKLEIEGIVLPAEPKK